MNIVDLKPGVRATVAAIEASAVDEQRLREHGVDEGVEIELLHRAALGADPIAIRVGNCCVAMRRVMARHILVTVEETPFARHPAGEAADAPSYAQAAE
jgi:ferrous iron transport protein A